MRAAPGSQSAISRRNRSSANNSNNPNNRPDVARRMPPSGGVHSRKSASGGKITQPFLDEAPGLRGRSKNACERQMPDRLIFLKLARARPV